MTASTAGQYELQYELRQLSITSGSFIIVLWFALLVHVAGAAARLDKPFVLTFDEVRRKVLVPLPEGAFAKNLGNLHLRGFAPNLLVAGYLEPEDLTAARAFTELIHGRYGFRLILLQKIEGSATPVFSGLVVDEDGRIVANFKLLSGFRRTSDLISAARKAAAKIDRYSGDRAHYAGHLFKKLRLAAGFGVDAPVTSLEVATPNLRNRYTTGLKKVRRLIALFEPGRPTWLLADLLHEYELERHQRQAFADLSLDARFLEAVFVLQPDRLHVVRDGRVAQELLPTCQVDLQAAHGALTAYGPAQ